MRPCHLGPSTPTLISLSAHDVVTGILRGGLPQLPLTTLNSVIAVCALSAGAYTRPLLPNVSTVCPCLSHVVGCFAGFSDKNVSG